MRKLAAFIKDTEKLLVLQSFMSFEIIRFTALIHKMHNIYLIFLNVSYMLYENRQGMCG